MKLLPFELNKDYQFLEVRINPENPYFAVRNVTLNYPNPTEKKGTIASIKQIAFKSENETISKELKISNAFGSLLNPLEKQFQIFNDASIQKVTLELLHFDQDDELSIDFEIQLGRDLLEMKKPWQEFNDHISNPVNTKIFFSAPFGQGKTTFLNEFFNQEKETYEVFRIFPVNYSVASNQDVFRYIKADLLFQLAVEKECRFQKLDASYLETIPKFIRKNPDKILAPFLMLIPEVGKSLFSFYEKMKSVTDSFVTAHESESIDDSKEVDAFWEKLLSEEGSIFEDNLLTQIIRQQIKEISKKKKSVLVIDDLDRLDPEHTFRILNIISAHYDIYDHSASNDYNKFGFDKIIVVCDIENVKNIFHHRYGLGANFSGYINKFYSTSHFPYDNKKVMEKLIDNILDFHIRNQQKPQNYFNALRIILRILISADQISLRDMLKLTLLSLKSHVILMDSIYVKGYYGFKHGLCTPIISLLGEQYNEPTLKSMINNCRFDTFAVSAPRLDDICWDLMAPIVSQDDNKKGPFDLFFNNKLYTLDLESEIYTERLRVKGGSVDGKPINFNELHFNQESFCDLLITNVEWYFSLIKRWESEKNG